MESITTDQPARWIVHQRTVSVPAKADGIPPTTKQAFYWKLNQVVPVPVTDPPRFYLMKPEVSDFWFIPKRFVDTYIDGMPPRVFPNIGLNMSDAYGLDGKAMDKVVAEKPELKVLLEDGRHQNQNASKELHARKVTHRLHMDGLRDYFTFDAFDPSSIDKPYVKLSDNDLRLMNTTGGMDQPEEIYILEKDIDHFALSNENGHRFEIRTEDGTAKMFQMKSSVSVTKEEWAARKKRAINSMDGDGGWTRMINPDLTLHLVPVSPDWFGTLQGIMNSIDTPTKPTQVKCLQTWQIYESQEQLLATNGAVTHVFIPVLNQDIYVLIV